MNTKIIFFAALIGFSSFLIGCKSGGDEEAMNELKDTISQKDSMITVYSDSIAVLNEMLATSQAPKRSSSTSTPKKKTETNNTGSTANTEILDKMNKGKTSGSNAGTNATSNEDILNKMKKGKKK